MSHRCTNISLPLEYAMLRTMSVEASWLAYNRESDTENLLLSTTACATYPTKSHNYKMVWLLLLLI